MKFLMIALGAAALLGCEQGGAGEESVASLMQTSRDWSKVAQTGDVDKIADYFADDAIIVPAGEQPVRGKQAIRAYLAEAKKIPGFQIRWEPIEGKVAGDMGYLLERTQMTMTGPEGTPVTDTMQAVTVWRKAPDGSWKNIVDASIPGPKAPAQPGS